MYTSKGQILFYVKYISRKLILWKVLFKKKRKRKETGKEIEWEPAINIAIYIGSWGGVKISHPPSSGPSAGQSLPTLHNDRGHPRAGARPSNVLGLQSRTDWDRTALLAAFTVRLLGRSQGRRWVRSRPLPASRSINRTSVTKSPLEGDMSETTTCNPPSQGKAQRSHAQG